MSSNIYTHLHAKKHICMDILMHTCMCVYIQTHVCLSTYIHIYINTTIHDWLIHKYIHTYIHICMSTYKHIYFQKSVYPEFQDALNICVCKKPYFWKYGSSEILEFPYFFNCRNSGNMEIWKYWIQEIQI